MKLFFSALWAVFHLFTCSVSATDTILDAIEHTFGHNCLLNPDPSRVLKTSPTQSSSHPVLSGPYLEMDLSQPYSCMRAQSAYGIAHLPHCVADVETKDVFSLSQLPRPVKVHLFGFLNPKDLYHLSLVYARDSQFWMCCAFEKARNLANDVVEAYNAPDNSDHNMYLLENEDFYTVKDFLEMMRKQVHPAHKLHACATRDLGLLFSDYFYETPFFQVFDAIHILKIDDIEVLCECLQSTYENQLLPMQDRSLAAVRLVNFHLDIEFLDSDEHLPRTALANLRSLKKQTLDPVFSKPLVALAFADIYLEGGFGIQENIAKAVNLCKSVIANIQACEDAKIAAKLHLLDIHIKGKCRLSKDIFEAYYKDVIGSPAATEFQKSWAIGCMASDNYNALAKT